MTSVNTIHGEMDTALLEKREGSVDDSNETTNWVEYWLSGELVHRSVDVVLKSQLVAECSVGEI
jgi:hypothetical protein